MAVGTRMQQRRATAAQWNTSAYVLAPAELGVATDTGVIKIGDGSNVWSDLDPAFDSVYLPILGKAADSELLDGINSTGFIQLADVSTSATADKIARRDGDGRMKAAAGESTNDVVNYDQMVAADTVSVVDARKELVSRSVSADITLALTDIGRLINIANANYTPTLNCNIPLNSSVAFPVGSFVDISSTSKGTVTFVPAGGVTLNGTTLLYGEYSTARLLKTGTDTWQVLSVRQSPGPILRRKIKAGADNTLTSGVFARLRLDGANSGTALFSNNADTLGANEQWSSADNYRAFCRRQGWYNIAAQAAVAAGSNGRFFVQLRVNNIEQHLGSGGTLNGSAEVGSRVTAHVPLNVGDYVEVWAYQEATADRTINDSTYGASFFEWAWARPL